MVVGVEGRPFAPEVVSTAAAAVVAVPERTTPALAYSIRLLTPSRHKPRYTHARKRIIVHTTISRVLAAAATTTTMVCARACVYVVISVYSVGDGGVVRGVGGSRQLTPMRVVLLARAAATD